jgi:AraC-like DNA-binding protein
MHPAKVQPRIVFQTASGSPIGRIVLAGLLKNHAGIPELPMRVLGHYALVYLLRGHGMFRSADGNSRKLVAGDIFFVFPDIPHWYGPSPGSTWDEFYIVFSGPVFDLWRAGGLLDSSHPPRHLEPLSYWLRRLEESVLTETDSLQQVCSLQHLLAEALEASGNCREPDWLARACRQLESGPGSPRQVARANGMSYDNFRRRFAAETGIPPGRYQLTKRMDRACALMAAERVTNKEIAERLDFCDEFHFSRTFKSVVGLTPAQFRSKMPQPGRKP